MFEQIRNVQYSHLAPNKKVCIPEIFRFLQDVAVAHSNTCGFSLEKLGDMKRAWLLLSTHIVLKKEIPFPATLNIQTWIYDYARAFSPRAFILKDKENGNEYAVASSMWAFIDTENGHPKEIPDIIRETYGMGLPSEVECERRAPKFECSNSAGEYKVQKRDIDSNFHVNNVRYIEYALETLPDEFYVKEIEIFYKHPVHYGEKISLFTEQNHNNDFFVTIQNEKQETCTYVKFVTNKKAIE